MQIALHLARFSDRWPPAGTAFSVVGRRVISWLMKITVRAVAGGWLHGSKVSSVIQHGAAQFVLLQFNCTLNTLLRR